MLATAIIAFREFFEAFLLVGLFIGIDRKLHLNKRREIISAATIGIAISLLLPMLVFFFSGDVKSALNEKNTDMIEGYFLIFSGFFLAYVVFSLHTLMKQFRNATIAKVHKKMEKQIFDLSLFCTIIFFIAREGFEIALIIATTSIFSVFWTNMSGLLLGFFIAASIGFATIFTYIKLPIKKVFQYTEYLILIIGAAMVKNGISMLVKNYTHISLEKFFPLPLKFLPDRETNIVGHLLNNIFGIQANLSLLQLVIMAAYITTIYLLFINKKAPAEIENKPL
jgi:FTR1 family protein